MNKLEKILHSENKNIINIQPNTFHCNIIFNVLDKRNDYNSYEILDTVFIPEPKPQHILDSDDYGLEPFESIVRDCIEEIDYGVYQLKVSLKYDYTYDYFDGYENGLEILEGYKLTKMED